MKRRILSLADDFIAGTHEALNVKAAGLGKALVSLHMYVAGLRSKAYGSMQHSSLDEGSILALAEPTGEFNAGVRVEKTFFHTSWDLKIINCVDIRAFLLVVERNIIQPSPGAAGIGLLAPMSSTTLYVGGQCHDPLQVCSSDSTSSQLLAVETEAQPSEAEELRSVIAKGLSDAAERHGQYHMEQLQTIGTLHQKVQEETRLAVAAAAATQLQAMEDRLNEFKRAQAEASSKNPRSSKNLMGQAKTSLGYAVFVHGYPVPIHLVNHMQAGCAYAPMHGIQFSETTTEKYSTEQKF